MNPTFPYGVNTCKAACSVKTVGMTQSQHPKSKLMRLTPEGGATWPVRVTWKVLPLVNCLFSFFHKLFIVK